MPRRSEKLAAPPDVKVVIRNAQGKYLAGAAAHWFFTDERSAAIVLLYHADHVPEQIEHIQKTLGIALVADPVPLHEIYETCDRCKELFMPFMTFFDGRQFLCADCRTRLRSRTARA